MRDVNHVVDLKYVRLQFRGLGLDNTDLLLSLFFVSLIVIVDLLEFKIGDIRSRLLKQTALVRWPVYYFITFSIIYFAPYNTAKNFIYILNGLFRPDSARG